MIVLVGSMYDIQTHGNSRIAACLGLRRQKVENFYSTGILYSFNHARCVRFRDLLFNTAFVVNNILVST
jgi:hypothetical protein